MNIGDWLYKRSWFTPDRPAILFDDRALTYAEFNKRVNRLCHAMMEKGLKTGERVGVLSRNYPEFLEVYFACAKTASGKIKRRELLDKMAEGQIR